MSNSPLNFLFLYREKLYEIKKISDKNSIVFSLSCFCISIKPLYSHKRFDIYLLEYIIHLYSDSKSTLVIGILVLGWLYVW